MRKVFAVLFLLVGLWTGVEQLVLLSDTDRLGWMMHVALIVFAVTSFACGVYLIRPRESWDASLVCPHCRQARLSPSIIGQPHPSLLAFLIGGVIVTVLIQQSQTRRFQCAACAKESNLRTVGSWVAVAWCLSFIFLIVVAALSEHSA